MKCLRILRRPWIYSIFAFSFFLFFSVFGLSPNSYATSVTCTFTDFSSSSNNTDYRLSDYCDSWFTPVYSTDYYSDQLYFYDYTLSATRVGVADYTSGYIRFRNTWGTFNIGDFPLDSTHTSGSSSYSGIFYVPPLLNYVDNGVYYSAFNFIGLRFYGGSSFVFNFTFHVTDNLSDITGGGSTPEPEPCPVCPVVPENPYDDKFDALTKAIYCCGAILIMLYFFFCIYKIIVKDGGSR